MLSLKGIIHKRTSKDDKPFASLFSESEGAGDDDLSLLTDTHAGHGAVHPGDDLSLAQGEGVRLLPEVRADLLAVLVRQFVVLLDHVALLRLDLALLGLDGLHDLHFQSIVVL